MSELTGLDSYISHCANKEHQTSRLRRLVTASPAKIHHAAAEQLDRLVVLFRMEMVEYQRSLELGILPDPAAHKGAKRAAPPDSDGHPQPDAATSTTPTHPHPAVNHAPGPTSGPPHPPPPPSTATSATTAVASNPSTAPGARPAEPQPPKHPPPPSAATTDTRSTLSHFHRSPTPSPSQPPAFMLTPIPSIHSPPTSLGTHRAKRHCPGSPPSALRLSFSYSPTATPLSPPPSSLICVTPSPWPSPELLRPPTDADPALAADHNFYCSQADTSDAVQLPPSHHVF